MEFRVLGAVEAYAAGTSIDLGSRQQRLVLGLLLLEPGRPVTVDRLVELVWGSDPPASARGTLQALVSRLRACLRRARDATGADPPDSHEILRTGGGYLLRVDPGEVDVHRFTDLVTRARQADDAPAVELFDLALQLWRGDPLADVAPTDVRDRLCAGLREVMWTAVEDRLEARIRLGRSREALDELTKLVAEHPFRQRLAGQLMLVLHREGRTDEALRTYRDLRARLVAEFGLDPTPELRQLEAAILRADPTLEVPPGRPTGSRPRGSRADPPVRPAELPPAHGVFVGRHAELATLDGQLDAARCGDGAGVVVIDGMGGIGKTALALHWGHLHRRDFPDGQVYLDLRGFSPGDTPMRPAEALPRLLLSLGVPPADIPPTVDAQSGRMRSLTDGRRLLLVLDNAYDASQVRPLLPGNLAGLVVVTSRRRLTGLVVREQAVPLSLAPLRPTESVDLVAGCLHRSRPDEREALADYCGHVPLAIRIVAARALELPDRPLGDLLRELRRGRRLDAFAEPDGPDVNLRTVFSWSYRCLSPPAAELFWRLALHPGESVGVHAAAALAGLDLPRVRELAAELHRASLLQLPAPDRYQFHDLVGAYARELAEAPENATHRRLAFDRLLDWYLRTVDAAGLVLQPHRPHFAPPAPALVEPVRVDTYQTALSWCESERTNLLPVIRAAASGGASGHAWRIALGASAYWYIAKRREDWRAATRIGVAATRADGDRRAEGALLASLATALCESRRYAEAIELYQESLRLHEASGDRDWRATSLNSLAVAHAEAGRPDEALATFALARAEHRLRGNRRGEGVALQNMAQCHVLLGQPGEAIARHEEALTAMRDAGDRYAEAICIANLGEAHAELGDHDRAILRFREAVRLHRSTGNEHGRARTLLALGRSLGELGDADRARSCWRRALAVFDELGDPEADEIRALLGEPAGA
ncbi:DNA-binding transcriptional activator of the SARP family [Micromonospora echinaurantiaca]|uniref:DNA-binding transcriptional activator of the SARP family n=1 Tax=Micromonospora echinaurantiaca TaxID=47857 RepID=A0A1C5J3Y7_9ACTN|nr:BTAD domain-containing putative transcriptional regulator [Micromonospora echinaurantiaca]SCG64991.1 DNA-binding transcriptional activator of the SARP family [Micromonospora echinaurantiaca]